MRLLFKSSVIFYVAMVVFANVLSGVAFAATADEQCNNLGRQYQDFTGDSAPGGLTSNCYSSGGLINRGVGIALTLAASIAVLFIIIGGFRYMTSAGNETAAGAGKKTMMWASLGLGVVLLAGTIVVVVSQLVQGSK